MAQIRYLDTLKGTHFTGALIQNAIEVESVDFPSEWGTAGINECLIEGISIQSDQNLEWDVYLFSSSGHTDTDLDLDTFVDKFNWATTAGDRIAGAGQYYYPSPDNNMKIPYYDDSRKAQLHVALVNRSAGAKNAGATGEIKIRFALRPVGA